MFDTNLAFTKDNPLTIRAEKNAKVEFNGGIKLDAKKLKLVQDKSILNLLPPEKADGNLYMLDLKVEGISDFGILKKHGFGRVVISPIEAFYNKKPLHLAQYPNKGEGVIDMGKVIDVGKPIAQKRGKRIVYGDLSKEEHFGIFTYENPRIDRWVNTKDIWLYGIFSSGFCDDNLGVKEIDSKKKEIKLADRHHYELKSGRKYISDKGENWFDVATADLRGFVAYNLLEEADKDGEYFVDSIGTINVGKIM